MALFTTSNPESHRDSSVNADHFLVSGIRTFQHNVSETKSIKPLFTFHFFCSWFPLIAMTSSQPLRKGFSPCFKHLVHYSQSSYSSRALLWSVSSHSFKKKMGRKEQSLESVRKGLPQCMVSVWTAAPISFLFRHPWTTRLESEASDFLWFEIMLYSA